MNQTGALEIRASQVGRDTAFGRIIEAVERAEKSRAPVQKTADRMAACGWGIAVEGASEGDSVRSATTRQAVARS